MTVLQTLAVANYRSIRSLVMPLGPLNLITGANGSGESNLYRALRLLADAITLTKELGETAIEGQGLLDAPPWKWPER